MLIYLSEIISNVPSGCICVVEEVVNTINTDVKSYRLVAECEVCKTLREDSNATRAITEKAAKIDRIKNQIIQLSIEKDKATTLGFSDLVTQKTNEISTLNPS